MQRVLQGSLTVSRGVFRERSVCARGVCVRQRGWCWSTLLVVLLLGSAPAGGASFAPQPDMTLRGVGPVRHMDVAEANGPREARLALAISTPAREDDRIALYRQAESGQFESRPFREIPMDDPRFVRLADLNDDGHADLVVGQRRRLTFWFAENGFSDRLEFGNNNYRRFNSMWIGQMSRGTVRDVVAGPVWWRWLGDQRVQNNYFRGPQRNDNHTDAVADLEGNGETDVVLLAPGAVRIYGGPMPTRGVYPKDLSWFVQLDAPSTRSGSLVIADMDDDGRLDIVTSTNVSGDPSNNHVLVYLQNSPIGFSDGAGPSFTISGVAGEVFAADLSGNGLADLLVHDPARGRVFIFVQRSGRPLARDADQADHVLPIDPAHLVVRDVNANGRPDVIAAFERDGGTVEVYLNRR